MLELPKLRLKPTRLRDAGYWMQDTSRYWMLALLNRVPSRLPRLRESNPPATQGMSGQVGKFNRAGLWMLDG